jgi:hypothetical protein
MPLGLLAAMLAVCGPVFLCLPPWCDVVQYDLCARNVLEGGVHYRDAMDTNLPGAVWIHAAVRGLLGWRSETLRGADLAALAGTVWLLGRIMKAAGASPAARAWTALAIFAFYFFLPESCHCQRDFWMMLPAAAAGALRAGTLEALGRGEARGRILRRAVCEGALWGAAVWIKPFVVAPALAVWLTSLVCALRRTGGRRRLLAWDAAGLLAGGTAIGAIGLGWLWWSGTWPHFWDVMLNWSREYASGATRAQRIAYVAYLAIAFLPWSLATLVALCPSLAALIRALRRKEEAEEEAGAVRAVLGAFFLGWLIQAWAWQHVHEYVFATAAAPALAVLGAWRPLARPGWAAGLALGAFGLAALLLHPMARGERLALYGRCWREGSSAEVRNLLLAGHRPVFGRAHWRDLAAVGDFLRQRGTGDGELACWNESTLPLYLDLGVRPASRFLSANLWLRMFPSRRAEVSSEIAAARPRVVVADLLTLGVAPENVRDGRTESAFAIPPSVAKDLRESYPWRERIVFRSGRYVVIEPLR